MQCATSVQKSRFLHWRILIDFCYLTNWSIQKKRILSGILNGCLSSPIRPKQHHCLQMWYLLEFASYKFKCLAELNPYAFHPCLLFHKKILVYGITPTYSCTILPKTFRINRLNLTEHCKSIISIISMPIVIFNFLPSTNNYHPYSFRTTQNLCQHLSLMH